jgi:hypothetical protein
MRIFLGAITKNLGDKFALFKPFTELLMSQLPGLEVFVYENNSTDSTPENLRGWAKSNPRVHVATEHYPLEFFLERGRARTYDNLPCRLEVHAFCRNKMLEMMEAAGMGLEEGDLTIIMDPDIPTLWPTDVLVQICSSFPEGADALFANGLATNGRYYDTYTYFDRTYPFGMELIAEERVLSEKYPAISASIAQDSPPRQVFNAFGGLAIYRSVHIRGLRYSGVVTLDLHLMNLQICHAFPENPYVLAAKEKPTTHWQGAQIGMYMFDRELFYHNNSGYNYPVVCEHVPFHASMAVRGHGRFFIIPQLLYLSDH